MPNSLSETKQMEASDTHIAQLSRRKFLGYASAATGIMVVASACSKEQTMDANNTQNGNATNAGVDLGSGDVGILNYAYALEQLEAAFYTMVVAKPYNNISPMELSMLTDIRDHEISHREFFKKAIPAASIIQVLEFDFSKIDFTSRDSVLGTAKAFEDLGVSAYNGAGRLIMTADYLVIAGKIVSVEARHAAAIRDLISNGSFADDTAVDAMGLDMTRKPLEVLAIASAYIKTQIDASHLPTY